MSETFFLVMIGIFVVAIIAVVLFNRADRRRRNKQKNENSNNPS